MFFITGSSGMVGGRFLKLFGSPFGQKETVFAPSHSQFDITGTEVKGRIEAVKKRTGISCLINFAAKTLVDECEVERGNKDGIVWRTNAIAPVILARACRDLDLPFVQISTDYVLSGDTYPHKEDEEINPVDSFYAQSKAEAERQLLAMSGKIHIIRIQRPFSDDHSYRGDMLRDAYRTNKENKTYFGITDQMLTPTYVNDCVRAINKIASSEEYGIWHVSSPDPISPYELISMAFKELEKQNLSINWGLLKVGKFDDFKDRWKSPRPRHTAFDVSKFESHFGKIRPLKEQIKEWAENFAKNLKHAKV